MTNREEIIVSLKEKMSKTISGLNNNLSGISTGRASPAILDPVMVDAYGDKMPINQVASVNIPEARLIILQVWDAGLTKTVEKAIVNANLGLTPIAEGQIIRIPIPIMSEERRIEMAKLAHKYGENAKIALRNIRRESIDIVKKLEKASTISQDEMHSINADIQKEVDTSITTVDDKVAVKELEITKV